jgi:hypothetical protein
MREGVKIQTAICCDLGKMSSSEPQRNKVAENNIMLERKMLEADIWRI